MIISESQLLLLGFSSVQNLLVGTRILAGGRAGGRIPKSGLNTKVRNSNIYIYILEESVFGQNNKSLLI